MVALKRIYYHISYQSGQSEQNSSGESGTSVEHVLQSYTLKWQEGCDIYNPTKELVLSGISSPPCEAQWTLVAIASPEAKSCSWKLGLHIWKSYTPVQNMMGHFSYSP